MDDVTKKFTAYRMYKKLSKISRFASCDILTDDFTLLYVGRGIDVDESRRIGENEEASARKEAFLLIHETLSKNRLVFDQKGCDVVLILNSIVLGASSLNGN